MRISTALDFETVPDTPVVSVDVWEDDGKTWKGGIAIDLALLAQVPPKEWEAAIKREVETRLGLR